MNDHPVIPERNRERKVSVFKMLMPVTPSVLMGIIAMICSRVPSGIWLLNPAVTAAAGVIVFAFFHRKPKVHPAAVLGAALMLLLLTLPGEGLEGVHRWIRLPGFQLNIAMIVLPVTLAAIYQLWNQSQNGFVLLGISAIVLILFLQPDASELTAFAVSMLFYCIVCMKKQIRWIFRLITVILLMWLSVLSWLRLDQLEPVSYVEGILRLLIPVSPVLFVFGVAALAFVPVSFLFWPFGCDRKLSVGLGLYYGTIIIATEFGSFPVPFMGYGVSPIIGYLLLFLLTEKKKEDYNELRSL